MKSWMAFGAGLWAVAALAGTQSFTWDGTSASYGSGVATVEYSGGKVTALAVTAAEGDEVSFTGATAASFAADAKIVLNGRGALVFENPVTTAGALNLMSEITNQTYTYGFNLKPGQTQLIPTDLDVHDFTYSAEYWYGDSKLATEAFYVQTNETSRTWQAHS